MRARVCVCVCVCVSVSGVCVCVINFNIFTQILICHISLGSSPFSLANSQLQLGLNNFSISPVVGGRVQKGIVVQMQKIVVTGFDGENVCVCILRFILLGNIHKHTYVLHWYIRILLYCVVGVWLHI